MTKLFNNKIGRWILGVPKGKKIYKITNNSAHYYTGEYSKKGLPIISTGWCYAGNQNRTQRRLQNIAKVLAIIPLVIFHPISSILFMLTDTNYLYPSTGSDDDSSGTLTWSNPSYITVNDANESTVSGDEDEISHWLQGTNFSFGVTAGSTINGFRTIMYGKVDVGGLPQSTYSNKIVIGGSVVGNAKGTVIISAIENRMQGATDDLWGTTPSAANVNASNFGYAVQMTFEGTNLARFNYLRMSVSYTAPEIVVENATFFGSNF